MVLEHITHDVVRDYECDTQGIVNNAEFMHYCEHARNQCIFSLGYNLETLHHMQEDPVVAHAQMNFIRALRGGNKYAVHTKIERKGSMRLLFYQSIYNTNENMECVDATKNSVVSTNISGQLCFKSCFTIAIVRQGRPLPITHTVFAKLFG